MTITTSQARGAVAICIVACALGAAAVHDLRAARGPARAEAVAVPARIGPDSSVTEILRFAETSSGRWRTLRATGHTGRGAAATSEKFDVVVERPHRARVEQAGVTRVRDGAAMLTADAGAGTVRRFVVPARTGPEQRASDARMAAHQADDPTLSRPGERIVDTPVNDLISPAPLIRRELRMAAVSVERVGSRTVAGRQSLVLEVRFPSELSKEDHWDLYVDVRTGILLGMVIEPPAGEERYETWIDSLEIDPVLDAGLFDTSAPSSAAEARP